MKNLRLNGITVSDVQFISASAKTGNRKRQVALYASIKRLGRHTQSLFSPRSTGNKCAGDIYTSDPIFTISLSISYPKSCTTPICWKKHDIDVQYRIKSMYREFTLTLKFKDGRRITLPLNFCSFIPRSMGERLFFRHPFLAFCAVCTKDMKPMLMYSSTIFPSGRHNENCLHGSMPHSSSRFRFLANLF